MRLLKLLAVRVDAAAHLRLAFALKHDLCGRLTRWLHRAQSSRHLFDQSVVTKISRRRYHHAARLVTGFEELDEILSLETVDRRFPAANRPRDRMIIEKIQTKQIVNVVVRGVFRLGNLLEDHRTLALDLFGIESRVEEDIG